MTYYEVTTFFHDNGRESATITDMFEAKKPPQKQRKETKDGHSETEYFKCKFAAIDYCKSKNVR